MNLCTESDDAMKKVHTWGRIPKKIVSQGESLYRDPDEREQKQLHCDIMSSCFKSTDVWKIRKMLIVRNPDVEKRFMQKRHEIKERHGQNQAKTILAFLAVHYPDKMCKSGIPVGLTINPVLGVLGVNNRGIHLFRHADLCVLNSHDLNKRAAKLVICKVLLGKSKGIDVGLKGSVRDPTPNFDSHVSHVVPSKSDSLQQAAKKSLVYLYEYDEEEALPVRYPRQCLPIAVVTIGHEPLAKYELIKTPSVKKREIKTPSGKTIREILHNVSTEDLDIWSAVDILNDVQKGCNNSLSNAEIGRMRNIYGIIRNKFPVNDNPPTQRAENTQVHTSSGYTDLHGSSIRSSVKQGKRKRRSSKMTQINNADGKAESRNRRDKSSHGPSARLDKRDYAFTFSGLSCPTDTDSLCDVHVASSQQDCSRFTYDSSPVMGSEESAPKKPDFSKFGIKKRREEKPIASSSVNPFSAVVPAGPWGSPSWIKKSNIP